MDCLPARTPSELRSRVDSCRPRRRHTIVARQPPFDPGRRRLSHLPKRAENRSLLSSPQPDLAARRSDFGPCANRPRCADWTLGLTIFRRGMGRYTQVNGPRQVEKSPQRLRLLSRAGRPRFASGLGLALRSTGNRTVRGQCAVDPGLFDRSRRTGVARAHESHRRLAVG
jgi:hypothetical protein